MAYGKTTTNDLHGKGRAMDFDALHLLFYVAIGLTVAVVAFAVLKIAFRNVPLWLFELWPHLLGLVGAAVVFWLWNWQWALVVLGLGLALGFSWSAALDHARKRGRENSRLERAHYALIKWAQK